MHSVSLSEVLWAKILRREDLLRAQSLIFGMGCSVGRKNFGECNFLSVCDTELYGGIIRKETPPQYILCNSLSFRDFS